MCSCVCQAGEFEDRSSKKEDGVEILVDQQDGKEILWDQQDVDEVLPMSQGEYGRGSKPVGWQRSSAGWSAASVPGR